MIKHQFLPSCLFIVVALFIMLMSCKKESANQPPSVSLSDTAKTVNENVGTVPITINLSKAASQDTKFTVSFSGSAILNGDYEVDSSTQITIPAGKTSATLNFTIYDDAVVEPDKTIIVKFSSTSNVSLPHSTVTITIKDNDVSKASSGLQADLYWDAGSMVDLDLYIANNVTITNNTVTNFNVTDSSIHDKGFESALIKNSDPDGDYYIAVYYNSGSRNVNYTLRFNGPGVTNDTSQGSFTASEVGVAYFFGPIHKLGSTYTRLAGSLYNLQGLKPYIYEGRLKNKR